MDVEKHPTQQVADEIKHGYRHTRYGEGMKLDEVFSRVDEREGHLYYNVFNQSWGVGRQQVVVLERIGIQEPLFWRKDVVCTMRHILGVIVKASCELFP